MESGKNEIKLAENKAANGKHKIVKFLGAVLIILLVVKYFYILNVHSWYFIDKMYSSTSSDDTYMCESYIHLLSEDSNDGGTIRAYYLVYFNDADPNKTMPVYFYKASFPCDFWEWKSVIGPLKANNIGKSWQVVPKGYERVDVYAGEGITYGLDMFYQEIDVSDAVDTSAWNDYIDIGTNNIMFDGTAIMENENIPEYAQNLIDSLDYLSSEQQKK